MRKPTPQQEAIYEVIRGQGSHAVISALAGSGKTTTAVGCLQVAPPGRTAFIAFNAHIAKELSARLPSGIPAMTLHALGHTAIRRCYPDVQLDEQKLKKLAKSLAPGAYPSVRIAAESLTRLCKYTLTDENDSKALDELVEHYGVEIDGRDQDTVYALTAQLVLQSSADTRTIDFDDMVWFPIRNAIPVNQYDLLLCDESQDLNRVQQALALEASRDGRLIPIGDRFQAIYGFTGADNEALPRLHGLLSKTERGCQELPLTVTWRCPRSHVELAQKLVPALEAAPAAEEGAIDVLSLKTIQAEVKPGDLVIARCNAPLVSLTYKLILAGQPAYMRGREIGRGLLNLITRLKPKNISDLVDRIEDFREGETKRLYRRNASPSARTAMHDRCDCLSELATPMSSLDELERFISTRFTESESTTDKIVLSSVHRAKGLESGTVYILDPSALPMYRGNQRPWELQQEKNLAYVAVTRAKKRMVFQDQLPSLLRSTR